MNLRRSTVGAWAAVLVVVAGGWFLAGDTRAPDSFGQAGTADFPASPGSGWQTADGPDAALSPALRRQQGADSAAADVFLQNDLRFKFEALLLEAGEAASPSELKRRLAALLPGYFSAADRARALALLERYVDYRAALGEVKGAAADARDPRALRAAIEARQRLREKHFDNGEYSALFADEEELDRFTLARLEIERNPALTPAQQQAAVRQAESEMSDAQRTARAASLAHETVAAQTAAFDSQGASAQDRYAQRREQYGDAAARQLAQLDSEEKAWQARLNDYENAAKSNASPAQLEQLQKQWFSAEEQLRIDAALAIRQQRQAATAMAQTRQ